MSTSSEGRPGRYQRSVGGLVAALVITVAAVGGLLWFLGLFRADVDNRPEAIDYLETVGEAQDAKLSPAYPSSLPKGWIATGFDIDIDNRKSPVFEIRMLTGDDKFLAVHQETTSATALVTKYVDQDASATDIFTADGSVAQAWQGYKDAGGDSAYVSEVDGQTIIVYGSASPADLQDLVDRLTTAPVSR